MHLNPNLHPSLQLCLSPPLEMPITMSSFRILLYLFLASVICAVVDAEKYHLKEDKAKDQEAAFKVVYVLLVLFVTLCCCGAACFLFYISLKKPKVHADTDSGDKKN
uniref:Transmembrane protein n=1 Tax=Panagrellus redivivus TaxID=6233 RepID=A0A7E4V1U4_PANRE